MNRKKAAWALCAAILALPVLLGGCGKGQDAPQVKNLTAKEAKELMDRGEAVVVDVRTEEEYAQAHIPGAVLLPNEAIDAQTARELLPDREALILVYCRSGRRSAQAARKLVDLGYEDVSDFGGIIDWPYDTQTGEGAR